MPKGLSSAPRSPIFFFLSNNWIRNTKECRPHGGGAVNSQDSKEMQMNTLLDWHWRGAGYQMTLMLCALHCLWLGTLQSVICMQNNSHCSSLQGPPSCHASLRLHTGARKTPGGSDSNLCPSPDDKLESICCNGEKKNNIFFSARQSTNGLSWIIERNQMSVQTSLKHLDAFREVQGTFGTAKPEDQYSCQSSSGTVELWCKQEKVLATTGKH